MKIISEIPSVNFHMWKPCNMRCRFCFATFEDIGQSALPKGHLQREDCLAVMEALALAGFEKINFAGGEPTLCPWLPDLIRRAKDMGPHHVHSHQWQPDHITMAGWGRWSSGLDRTEHRLGGP